MNSGTETVYIPKHQLLDICENVVTQSIVFCVVFCRPLLVLLSYFSFGFDSVSAFPFYGF